MSEWLPIESAPRDGRDIVAYGKPAPSCDAGPYVTYWSPFGAGSISHEKWKRGEGPEGAFWHGEPVNNWTNSWSPTHWHPLPAPPT